MVIIYVPQITERLQYIFDFFFSSLIRISYSITTNKSEYVNHSGPKFIYGTENIDKGVFFQSAGLLFEESIVKHNLKLLDWKEFKVFFAVSNGELPFDPFAAAFYLITRYEEYLPGNRDRYGRFRAGKSIAFQGGFLKKPVVNIWAATIGEILQKKFNPLLLPEKTFSFLPTIDIDNAYAYKHKGFIKNAGHLVVSFCTFRFSNFFDRLKVLFRIKSDPYDTYEKQFYIQEKYNIKPLYFILLGDYSRYDRNISHKNKALRSLIQTLNKKAEVNLHPSYASEKSVKQIITEKERLEEIVGKKVIKSRQHYIKLTFPSTYRALIEAGIKEDYSMGFPSRTGFRAGTSSPFNFFDLEKNKVTDLKVFPFVAMDTTLKVYQKKRAGEVIEHLRPIVKDIKNYGGSFIFIFHNESLGHQRKWKNWGNMYEKVIKLALEEQDAKAV